jgi:dTDP-D-glucose 4,6-dehydratase
LCRSARDGADFSLLSAAISFIAGSATKHFTFASKCIFWLPAPRASSVLRRIDFIEDSVLDPAACARAVRGIDCVLHQAVLASVPRSIGNPSATHAANATGTLNLLIAARDRGGDTNVRDGISSSRSWYCWLSMSAVGV